MHWAYTNAGFIIGGVVAGYVGSYLFFAIAGGAIGFVLARVRRQTPSHRLHA